MNFISLLLVSHTIISAADLKRLDSGVLHLDYSVC